MTPRFEALNAHLSVNSAILSGRYAMFRDKVKENFCSANFNLVIIFCVVF